MGPQPDGEVRTILVTGGSVYAGGYFTTIGGAARNSLAELSAATGSATPWDPNPDSGVEDIVLGGGTLYVGGSFTTIGGQPRASLAGVDPITGLAQGFDAGLAGQGGVRTVDFDGTNLSVAGQFQGALNRPNGRLASFLLAPSGVALPGDRGDLFGLRVSANPLARDGRLNYVLPAAGRVSIRLHDAQGRLRGEILSDALQGAGEHAVALPVGALPAGIYWVNLEMGARRDALKIIVAR